MPIRIYDIARKLGLETKEVLTVAKELGIAAAKVPSSSLDSISGEWLEEHIIAQNPALAARLAPRPFAATPKPTTDEGKIQIIHAPPTPPVSAQPDKPKDQTEKPNDDSLAIRLKGDALVEIYSFSENAFNHHGSFAFQVEQGSNPQNVKGGLVEPEEIILLTNNENSTLEFKPSARWDCYQKRQNSDLAKAVVKSVAAFLNTEGGTLLIGVADNAKVLGLKQDFATLQKPKGDDYLLFLHSLLFDNLGHDLRKCIEVSILRLKGKEVCCVAVRKSPRPVYVKDGQNELFYARFGNSSKSLPLKAAMEYGNSRWPNSSANASAVWL